jgi:flagellar assembly factor FliW
MKVLTTRFGEIEVKEEEIFHFPEGILGFPDVKSYFILDNPKGGPFKWLQAVKFPQLAFVVCDPRVFMPSYKVFVKKEELASIKLEDTKEGFVMVILTILRDPLEITANLKGPLVFNLKEKLAKQVVLSDPGLTTRYKIFSEKLHIKGR